jgi:hypothetical protein
MVFQNETGHGMLELKPNLVDFMILLSCTLAMFDLAFMAGSSTLAFLGSLL